MEYNLANWAMESIKSDMSAVVRTINGGRLKVIGGMVDIGKPVDVESVAENSQQHIFTAGQSAAFCILQVM